MSNPAELIYKTTSPAAIDWMLDAHAQVVADRKRQREYEDEMTEQFGAPAHPEHVEEHRRQRRSLWFLNGRPYALDSLRDEKPPADSGWRLDSKDRIWKPNRSTVAGKARSDQLARLFTFDLRRRAHEIGIPEIVFASLSILKPGIEFDEDEAAIYATWSSRAAADEVVGAQAVAAVEGIEWVEVPRSEWYARLEAKEAVSETTTKEQS